MRARGEPLKGALSLPLLLPALDQRESPHPVVGVVAESLDSREEVRKRLMVPRVRISSVE